MLLSDCKYLVQLVFSDLRYESILSSCMMCALGAMIVPLFILMGLQEGIISNMITPLKLNPVCRLVTPKFPTPSSINEQWLESLRYQTSGAVIESSKSHLQLDIEGFDNLVTVIPTIAGDPLIVENHISFADIKMPVVLSSPLAKSTNKQINESITITLTRNTSGVDEKIPVQFHIAGILPISASSDLKLWISKEIFHEFDQWRRGRPAPLLGISSGSLFLLPEYDGIVTILDTVPTDSEYRGMVSRPMSFSEPPIPFVETGWRVSSNKHVRLWKTINSSVYESDIQQLVNRHYEVGNFGIETIPYLNNFQLELTSGEQTKQMKITILPRDADKQPENDDSVQVMLSETEITSGNRSAQISFYSGPNRKKVTIPVAIMDSPILSSGFIGIPGDLAGKINAAKKQESVYDPLTREFSPVDKEIRFFRAYAKTIDELEPLVAFIQKEGEKQNIRALLEPVSRIDEVRNIRQLAGYMEKLYFLIAAISGFSGAFAIGANVYAGVQRKKYDLAYLQLLGMHRWAIFLFPFFKSMVLIIGGTVMAYAGYLLFGYLSDEIFKDALQSAASLTKISWRHAWILLSAIFFVGATTSVIAGISVMRIEPGEYIRE